MFRYMLYGLFRKWVGRACAIGLLIAPMSAVAQQPVGLALWTLANHSSDLEVAINQIATVVTKDTMMPVGLHVDRNDRILALYALNSSEVPISEIRIHEFRDFSQLNRDMEAFVQAGWVPMDISHDSEGLYCLFLKIPLEIEEWRIASVRFNIVDIERTIDRFEADGFSAWGLSLYDDDVWLLFLRERNTQFPRRANLGIYRFFTENYTAGINQSIAADRYPWGLARHGAEILVEYTHQLTEEAE